VTRPHTNTRSIMYRLLPWAMCCAALLATPSAPAQVLLKTLPEIENVGIVEKRGNPVPRDLTFTNSFGQTVKIGDVIDRGQPIMLVMAYYDCPLLCTLVLNQVQRVLNELKWTAGEDFQVLTVSFDHTNTTAEARSKQAEYLLGYNRTIPERGWEFWTGDVENIRALSTAVGYHYKFIPETKEFSHVAALVFLTPDGNVHNYLEKLNFTSMEVRLALAEAAEGKVGTIFDRLVHFCFKYDPKTGQYSADAMNMMRVGATACAMALAIFVGYMAFSRVRRGPLPPGGKVA